MRAANKESNTKNTSGLDYEASQGIISLNRLNLSLLPSLKALLDMRSVTNAARELCVTQPTMSRNLAQLRESLCDPILVRTVGGTELSELAKEIHPQVNRLVVDAATIFENASFDPQTTSRHFHIVGSHVVVEQVLPKILCELRQAAPYFTFEVDLLSEHALNRLHQGEIDLAIGYSGTPPPGLRSQEFLDSRLSCIMGAKHPLAQRVFTIEELMEYPLLQLKIGSGSSLQALAFYEKAGLKPRMTISNVSAAQAILASSDYICFRAVVCQIADDNLVVRSIPDQVIELDSRIVWPEYWNANRSHRWLRDYIFQSMSQILSQKKL